MDKERFKEDYDMSEEEIAEMVESYKKSTKGTKQENEDEKKTVHRYLSLPQIEELRDAAHSKGGNMALRNEVLVVILADLGLRVNEATQLKRSMFNLDQAEVVIPSSIQKRYPDGDSPPSATLRIDPYGHFGTVRLLRTYFNSDWYGNKDTQYVFPSRQSNQMTTESVRNIVRDLAVEGDVQPRRTDGEPADPSELHPHALRHSLSNYMLADQDTRLIDVRNRLRHRWTSTTEKVYEHFQRR